jgi:hypothetical protein
MEQYFIRLRGRVTGPYDLGQLRNLRARGQFGRYHEVSSDQVRWSPAESLTEVFSERTGAIVVGSGTASTNVPAAGAEWYYLTWEHQQAGPVSLEELQGLLDQGKVDADTFVCKPGLPEWIPLSSLAQIQLPVRSGKRRSRSAWIWEPPLAALWVGLILGPLVGVVGSVVAAYPTIDGFVHEDVLWGLINLVLLLGVLVLSAAGTLLLALEYNQRLEQQQSRGRA